MPELPKFNRPTKLMQAQPAFRDGQLVYRRTKSAFMNPYEGAKGEQYEQGWTSAQLAQTKERER